jgi:hypothetical protein
VTTPRSPATSAPRASALPHRHLFLVRNPSPSCGR